MIARNALILVSVLFLIVGCSFRQPLSQEEFDRLKGFSTIHVIYLQPTEFLELTPVSSSLGGSLGLPGLPSPEGLGAQFVKDYSLQDPTLELRELVIGKLQSEGQLKNLKLWQGTVKKEDFGHLQQEQGITRALTFETIEWGLMHGIFDVGRYQWSYGVHVRLLDVRSFETLWQHGCRISAKNRFTLDELKEDNAAMLKKQLHDAVDTCGQEILGDLIPRSKEDRVK